MTVTAHLMTVAEFEQFIARSENHERRFELIDGALMEKDVVTQEHGLIAGNIVIHIGAYVKPRQLGRVYVEADYKPSADDHNWRTPDVSYVAGMDKLVVKKGAAPQMPDLAVEVKSPGNRIADLRDKAAFYTAHGTRLVWIVLPEPQVVEVYCPDQDVIVLNASGMLDGFDVLPGFTLSVSALFED